MQIALQTAPFFHFRVAQSRTTERVERHIMIASISTSAQPAELISAVGAAHVIAP